MCKLPLGLRMILLTTLVPIPFHFFSIQHRARERFILVDIKLASLPGWCRGVRRSSTMEQVSSAVKRPTENSCDKAIEFTGVHHVGFLCESVERSLKFYCGLLGLKINPERPDDKLPFGGVWLNVGSPSQMIHLMELPNPDPKEGRPEHGGRDRHACVSVKDVKKVKEVFDKAGMLQSTDRFNIFHFSTILIFLLTETMSLKPVFKYTYSIGIVRLKASHPL
ncbi:hypothetical protein KC19_4G259600 [Ceratodon purpureus]|uniref:VOC domain-containing protein n=1 Tax=Ceratodon purpureus TaxID=3225 RepID=A0A8T0IF54_CERPU|nr:hypothetical protein KC19_4G259600 [Ceratodon purpureus]